MIIGFSGSREGMTDKQKQEFVDVISTPAAFQEFHHGDCVGADGEAHELVRKHRKDALIALHPPTDPKKRAFKQNDSDRVYSPAPYLVRDRRIVESVEMLIAAPKTAHEELRSGTWATIRHARRLGVPVILLTP